MKQFEKWPSDNKNNTSSEGKLFDNLDDKGTEIMRTSEAASFLRVSVPYLYNMCSRGLIVPKKVGRSNRFLRAELWDLLINNKLGGSNGN
jgi:excisionase family DNA binding protein